MAGTGSQEIIDLTESPPGSEPIVIESDEGEGELVTSKSSRGEKKKKLRRKKSKKNEEPEDGEVAESSGHASKEQSRERGTDRRQRRRDQSYSPKPWGRTPSPRPKMKDKFSDLFYVDVKPAQVPDSVKPKVAEVGAAENLAATTSAEILEPNKLLLPEHVSVFGLGQSGEGPVEIIGPATPGSKEDEDDFIEYLDYDDRSKGVQRYFDEISEDTKPARFVCKNCGAEGQHKTSECPVRICLTCGARDEHSTRSCPISKTCYTCGMKGHINQNCPNRYNRDRAGMDSYDDCDRCGLGSHKTNECPTWWRMYEYVSDDERLRILQEREAKQHLQIGQGGEGYVGIEEYCYNCGGMGHWGDDCNEVPHLSDCPKEPSAFSMHNIMTGPFFDPNAERPEYQARHHDHDEGPSLPDDWGMDAPGNVGKQGRKKDRAVLEKKLQEQEADDDNDNWFTNPKNTRNRSVAQAPLNGAASSAPKKMITFGSLKDTGRQFQPPLTTERSKPKLLDRIEGVNEHSRPRGSYNDRRRASQPSPPLQIRGASSQKRSRDDDYSGRNYNGHGRYDRGRDRSEYEHDRDRDRNTGRDRRREGGRDRDREHRREAPKPQYKGGYSNRR